MRPPAFLAAILLCGATLAFPPPAAATGCPVEGEGSGTCYFSCPADLNTVGVGASTSSAASQFRSIEGEATCDGKVAAYCAGRGECHANGGGTKGAGSCTIRTGQGVDFTGGCSAEKKPEPDVSGLLDEVPELDDLDTGCHANRAAAPDVVIRLPVTCAKREPPASQVVLWRLDGVVGAVSCVAGACVRAPVVCVGDAEVACSVGLTEAQLRARYPDL